LRESKYKNEVGFNYRVHMIPNLFSTL